MRQVFDNLAVAWLALYQVDVKLALHAEQHSVLVSGTVTVTGQTGVWTEALTAAAVAVSVCWT